MESTTINVVDASPLETTQPIDDQSPLEMSVPGAMWRHRWLVLGAVAFMVALGFLYLFSQPDRYLAETTLVVEEPAASALFESGGVQRPERYVADQVAILESTAVAERAARNGDLGMTVKEVLDATSIVSTGDSGLILIQFDADQPPMAVAGANAIAIAYQEVRHEQASRTFDTALEQLDDSIVGQEAVLEGIQAQIAELVGGAPVRAELASQYEDALARLADAQTRLWSVGREAADAVRQELDDLLQQFQTQQIVASLETQQPRLVALLQQQSEAIRRSSELIGRRDKVRVDSRLEGNGVVQWSAALEADETAGDLVQPLAAAAILGLVIGGGLAYALALRRHRFDHPQEPAAVLRAPLLALVPDFSEETDVRTDLPVRDAPWSAAAEAFRFVLTSIEARLPAGHLTASPTARPRALTIAVVSAGLADGKTVVVANAALAAARTGKRVLAIDADFGSQRLSEMLLYEKWALSPLTLHERETETGMTEIFTSDCDLQSAVARVEVSEGIFIDVLPRGREHVSAPDFFQSDAFRSLFTDIANEYDLVFVDTPPLLQVAYVSTIVGYSDQVLVVVPHESSVEPQAEVHKRLELIGTPPMGYVYTKAPLTREMSALEGSMADVLGTGDTGRRHWRKRGRGR